MNNAYNGANGNMTSRAKHDLMGGMKTPALMFMLMLLITAGCSSIRIPDLPDVPRPPEEDDPAPPIVEPVNDPAQPPADWRAWQGAPKALVPGVDYRAVWKAESKPPPAGVWRFEYRTHGGKMGMIKPSTTLWLVPRKNPTNGMPLRPDQIGTAGIYSDAAGTQLIKWLYWPGGVGGKAIDGTHPATDPSNAAHYHNDGLILRWHGSIEGGWYFFLRDVYGQTLFNMQSIDKGSIVQ